MQSVPELQREGEVEATVLVKASPTYSSKHRETVCCAAVDDYRQWLRVYPVSFRYLDKAQKFGRWHRIRLRWRRPNDDSRIESRRIDQDAIEIAGKMPEGERATFFDPLCVGSLNSELAAGRSLALLRPNDVFEFKAIAKDAAELDKERDRNALIRTQGDLLANTNVVPLEPCPFRFIYKYRDDDGDHIGTCQDWETEATFFRLRGKLGETAALQRMAEVFGHNYSRDGMALAMGTHSRRPKQWLVNGVLRLDRLAQVDLFAA